MFLQGVTVSIDFSGVKVSLNGNTEHTVRATHDFEFTFFHECELIAVLNPSSIKPCWKIYFTYKLRSFRNVRYNIHHGGRFNQIPSFVACYCSIGFEGVEGHVLTPLDKTYLSFVLFSKHFILIWHRTSVLYSFTFFHHFIHKILQLHFAQFFHLSRRSVHGFTFSVRVNRILHWASTIQPTIKYCHIA